MNYLKVYCKLIRKAEKRNWNKKNSLCYVEGHHTFPVSIFGQDKKKNKRIVFLTAKEHYISHKLLVKIFQKRCGVNHWKTEKMRLAFWCMNNRYFNEDRYFNSKDYEKFKVEWSKTIKKYAISENGIKKISESQKKRKRTKEQYDKIAKSLSKPVRIYFEDGRIIEDFSIKNFTRNNPQYNASNIIGIFKQRRSRHKDIVGLEYLKVNELSCLTS